MPRVKSEQPARMLVGDDKDILIAYCEGLTVKQAKKAYLLLREEFSPDRSKYLRFNKLGKQDKDGLVKLKKVQLTRLLKKYPIDMVEWMIGKLHDYIEYLHAHRDESQDMRTKYRRYRDCNHYQVMANGWVKEEYLRTHPEPTRPEGWIDFFKIRTSDEALAYIEQEGVENLIDSPELEFLTCRFNRVADYIVQKLKEIDSGIGYQQAITMEQ